MKHPLLIFFLSVLLTPLRSFMFMVLPLFSFSQLTDNFSDGDFTNNPTWVGNNADFTVSNGVLRSNGPQASSVIYLATASTMLDSTEWNFLVRLDFNPSSTNQVRIYLASDQQNLSGNLNGYYIQLGESGTAPDSLDIFRQTGGAVTKIFTGTSGCMSSSTTNSVRIRVVRHTGGAWNVYADCTGGSNLAPEGNFNDNNITVTSYFGVVCDYSTGSRYNLYYFDDFSIGNIVVDTTKPTVANVPVLSSTQIDVVFSEPVDTGSANDESNYFINGGIGAPLLAVRDGVNFNLVHLFFTNPFQNATNYVLDISGVKDLSGNQMNPYPFPFSFYNPGVHDIVINEIFADPDPRVTLPQAEFVELYNTTQFPVSLSGWKFSDGSTTVTISSGTILPDSFVIVCKNDSGFLFQPYGSVIALSSLPSLNNTSDNLALYDKFDNLIHYVPYSDSWYKDNTKKDGGWTLEMIDPANPCGRGDNWRASVDITGGTPGRRNSIFTSSPDIILPQVIRASLDDSATVTVYFSEVMNSLLCEIESNYVVNNNVGSPYLATAIALEYNKIQLKFLQPFIKGTIYTIQVLNLTDCSGNPLGMSSSARFAIPDSVQPGDVVINEILFNPRTGGYDFVELYNRSTRVIDLRQIEVLEKDIRDPQNVLEQTSVSSESYLFFPSEFVALTESTDNILLSYLVENPSALLNIDLPNYDDNESICVLKIRNGATIDSLAYDHDWHFALLDDENGVSLERIDYNRTTQDKNNWHSAASTVGFATPTYRNSQFSETGITDDEIEIKPEVFTPDNDGEKDFTFINYKFSEAGYTLNAKVYDAKGREIRTLVRNELLGSEGNFQWDGTDDDSQKARTGIYIIYLEVFNLRGKVKKFKKQVVLGAKLN